MKILVACEESQDVTKELRELGYEAYSCDLLETSGGHPEWHVQADVLKLVNGVCYFQTCDGRLHYISSKWDMIIAFPPCTYLTVTGNRWFNVAKFGDPFEKKTCLWLKGLPLLEPTEIVDVPPRVRYKSGKTMPAWYADAVSLPKEERSRVRSKTFPGIAKAMAEQWAGKINE